MFDALLRLYLGPIIERLAGMETELEDLYRRADNLCRIGVCQEVDAATNTCKVAHGELLTPAIRFFNPSAGAQSESRIPSVGEQCLLLNHGGGDGGGQSVALFGLNGGQFPRLDTGNADPSPLPGRFGKRLRPCQSCPALGKRPGDIHRFP
ncbi:protein of unknown function [Pseudomonas mediterranea]